MPILATITSFYSFTANTKARASQVEWNFSQLRGHNIPINPSAQNAVNNTYDLGSTEWYWRTLHTKSWNKGVVSSTTTAAQSQLGMAALAGYGVTNVTTALANSTITVTSAGEPVEVSFDQGNWGSFYTNITTGAATLYSILNVSLYVDNSLTVTWSKITTNTVWDNTGATYPANAFRHFFTPAAGAHIYNLKYVSSFNTNITSITMPTNMIVRGVF